MENRNKVLIFIYKLMGGAPTASFKTHTMLKKVIKVQYGIEITKPWSKEMYAHNDIVAEQMKSFLMVGWSRALSKLQYSLTETEWNEEALKESDPVLVKLQRAICCHGFGSGFTIEDVNREVQSAIENIPNYLLHGEYAYLCFEDLVPRTDFMMVGYDWSKMDYHQKHNAEAISPAAPIPCSAELDNEWANESI